jgi:excisionase family DNA binding protein
VKILKIIGAYMENRPKLLRANDVAQILNVKVNRVWELTRENKIPFIQLGERQYRYSETALMNWLENGGTSQQTQTEQKQCFMPMTLSE